DHPMHMGFQTKGLIETADLILVLECDVPWLPALESPPDGCRVVHLGEDPACQRYPTRGFPVDLAIMADATAILTELDRVLAAGGYASDTMVGLRRDRLQKKRETMRARWQAQLNAAASDDCIRPEWISHCINEAVGPHAII